LLIFSVVADDYKLDEVLSEFLMVMRQSSFERRIMKQENFIGKKLS